VNIRKIDKLFIYEEKEEIENNKEGNILFNYNCSDREIFHSHGFSLQHSATRENVFAKPYYNFQNVSPVTDYIERKSWEYPLSFIGQGCWNGTVRRFFLNKLVGMMFSKGYNNFPDWKIKIMKKHFFELKEEDRLINNDKLKYEETMINSKFTLCPRGYGLTSVRFFEALSVNSIPVYIGDKEAKLPLDWIIDWDKAIFRINVEEIIDGSFWDKINNILSLSINETNKRRRYIYEIYWKYFCPNNESVHDNLVEERIKELFK